jgi:hypothetical protein
VFEVGGLLSRHRVEVQFMEKSPRFVKQRRFLAMWPRAVGGSTQLKGGGGGA